MTRRTLPAVLFALLALLAPAAAQANTVISWSAARLSATNDGAGTTVSLYTRELQLEDGSFHTFPAFSIGGPVTYPTADCIEDNTYIVCSDSASFLLQGGGGVDTLSISDEAELNAIPATLNGAGGNDKLQDFSPANRTLDGGDGNDVMFGSDGDDTLRGGPGNDEVDGEGGRDNVAGGDGDDKLYGDHFKAPAADVIDGGPGYDRVIDDWDVGAAVSVTLDNLANDGRPGENDNLIGIEEIEGPPGTYVGSDAAEKFVVGASGASSTVSGGGGNDDITTLNGSDGVDGGPGDDRIVGGFDNDTITGGPGRDAIFADATGSFCGIFSCTVPFGNDTINARDGEADSIDCGIGADRAVVDAIDTHANCETVEAAGPGGGGPGGGSGGVLGEGGGGGQPTLLTKRSIRRIAARGFKIRVACPAACTIVADLRTDRKLARKLRLPRSRKLAGARKVLRAKGSATLTLNVAPKAKSRFKRLRKATVTLRVRTTDANRKTTTVTRKLKLQR
jgi:hypothetical protein